MLSLKNSLSAGLVVVGMLPTALAQIPNADRFSMIVGNTSVDIGDADIPTLVLKYVAPKCNVNGCDEGSPAKFDIKFANYGRISEGSVTITTSGFSYFDAASEEGAGQITTLTDMIQGSLNDGKKCDTRDIKKCYGRRCQTEPLVPNYIQATMYGTLDLGLGVGILKMKRQNIIPYIDSKVKAQIEIHIKTDEELDDNESWNNEGEREGSDDWKCEDHIQAISDGAHRDFDSKHEKKENWGLGQVLCLATALDSF
ncbi:hypothetical protein HYFRA_00012973 [Hymenoscyphus fraxineus]|uniref:Uncharacterized protein n=1 Tax=Hymenoscyphus fraxineus TaxID=746836 RepID=A0A9N9L2Q5_9HELO|nr:hypothetical protein HYFRA_00012973 [Hymenoscyphus fraxineus]